LSYRKQERQPYDVSSKNEDSIINEAPMGEQAVQTTDQPFLSDIKTLRERARQHIENGAVVDEYTADNQRVCDILNEALATEIVCVLRYRRHHFMAKGVLAQPIKAEFLEHAQEEQEHADLIAERIVQLGGAPNFSPEGLATRSHAEYVEGETLIDMIKEDLVAERIAIESYTEIVRYLGTKDPTTRRLMESILAKEEEHADELNDLLEGLPTDNTQSYKILGA